MKSDKFSLKEYKKMLLKAKRLGYKFPKLSGFKNWMDVYPKSLLLRHDIDTSPLNALKMAEVEYSLGVTTNYYVLLHSKFYNPAAPPFFDALKKIVDMGHEIGLHYDCSFFEERKIDLQKGIAEDAKALENILGVKIKSISQHKPTVSGRIKNLGSRYIDAYNDDLINKMKYISDSGFKWRDKSLADLIGACPKIYALIHPTTWAYPSLGMSKTYKKCSKITEGIIRKEFTDFIKSTEEYLHKRMKRKIN
jgi:hypothetical protein